MREAGRWPATRVSWEVAIEAFLLASDYAATSRANYRCHLRRAGESLGRVVLASLTVEQLESFRSKVLAGPRGIRVQALMVPRIFLGWAAERGLLGLPPETIREALRAPGARRSVARMATHRRRRSGPAPPADTLAALGYPSGVGGLALVAEEIQGFREALGQADPQWWARLVRATDHPAHRQSDGGSVTAALAALRDVAEGGGRGGADAFLVALGYAPGPGGERRLLETLRRLRAAFVAQQRRGLGRIVWRARWTAVLDSRRQGDPRGGARK